MKLILLSLAILFQVSSASAQTVTDGETKVLKVFYVKEGTNSPYQGLLQLTPEEYSKIKPDELKNKQLKQFNNWKAATEAAKNAIPVEPTVDEKAAQVTSLQIQVDELAAKIIELKSDPAVLTKLSASAVKGK